MTGQTRYHDILHVLFRGDPGPLELYKQKREEGHNCKNAWEHVREVYKQDELFKKAESDVIDDDDWKDSEIDWEDPENERDFESEIQDIEEAYKLLLDLEEKRKKVAEAQEKREALSLILGPFALYKQKRKEGQSWKQAWALVRKVYEQDKKFKKAQSQVIDDDWEDSDNERDFESKIQDIEKVYKSLLDLEEKKNEWEKAKEATAEKREALRKALQDI